MPKRALSVQQLIEELCAVVKSLQEHPEIWDEQARIEASGLADELYSLMDVIS